MCRSQSWLQDHQCSGLVRFVVLKVGCPLHCRPDLEKQQGSADSAGTDSYWLHLWSHHRVISALINLCASASVMIGVRFPQEIDVLFCLSCRLIREDDSDLKTTSVSASIFLSLYASHQFMQPDLLNLSFTSCEIRQSHLMHMPSCIWYLMDHVPAYKITNEELTAFFKKFSDRNFRTSASLDPYWLSQMLPFLAI